MSDITNLVRERRAEAMVVHSEWCNTADYKPARPEGLRPLRPGRDASGPLPRWMVVTWDADDTTSMAFAYFYASRESALDAMRGIMLTTGETPEHLLDLDTGDYRDVVIETTFTLADTFTGEPDDIDDDTEDEE